MHSLQDHVSSFLNKYTKHTLYSQSDPASLAVTASAATMSSAIDTMHSTSSRLPTHQRCVISTILCAVLCTYESPCIVIICVHRCSQLESAIPMVDIYDDVFCDIDPTYSTIPDIGTTNNQQRYGEYIVFL